MQIRMQAMLCRQKLSWLVGILVLLPVAALAQPPASPVVVAKVQQRAVAGGQTFVGTVMPAKMSAVGSAVDGRVTEYPIEIGDRVTKTQPLCRLLTETISLQIAAAEAELRLRDEELRELKNGSRPEEVAQAKAKMEAAEAVHNFAEARFKRAEQLVAQGRTLTQEQLEEYLSAAVTAERNLQAAKEEYQLMVKGPREERIIQAQARCDAQRELVQQLKDQMRKHTMIAPFDGYVVAKRTELGEWVTRGQVVADVMFLDEVEIEAHVLDSQIDHVRLGMPAKVDVPALDQAIYVGEVIRISPQGDLKSRTFPVKVRVKNEIRDDGPVLKSGMLARVTLPLGKTQESLMVPKDAVVFGGPAPVVFAIVEATPPAGSESQGGGKAAAGLSVKPVPVELGVASGQWLEVKANLTPDDRVVILGNERLRPGAAVSILREDSPGEPTAKP